MTVYSSATTVASGSTPNVSVPFPYLRQADVHVKVNGVQTADNLLAWLNATTIILPVTPTVGDAILVYRQTDRVSLNTVYSSPSVFDPRDMNNVSKQLLYVTQEAFDLGQITSDDLAAITDYINTSLATIADNLDQSEADVTQTGVDRAAAAVSASAAAGSATTAGTWATTAQAWATQVGSAVATGLYSAKEWATGTFLRGVAGGGSAKDWANYTGGTVDNAEYSAKKYAQDAAASAGGGLVKVTASDTTAAALNSKLVMSGMIAKSTLSGGGNEQLQLALTAAVAADLTAGTSTSLVATPKSIIDYLATIIGVAANKLVQFTAAGKYPAADGSLITNLAVQQGLTLLATLTASASSALQDTTHITSTYDYYIFSLEDLVLTSGEQALALKVTTNGGSSWLATGYAGQYYQAFAGTVEQDQTITTYVECMGHNTANRGFSSNGSLNGVIHFRNPNSIIAKSFELFGSTISGSSFLWMWMSIVRLTTTSVVNGVQFAPTGSTIASGKIRIYGVTKV